MNKKTIREKILTDIKDRLAIEQYGDENIEQYSFRLIYSFLGKIILANLWNENGDNLEEGIIDNELKNVLHNAILGYKQLFSDMSLEKFLINENKIIDDILTDYLETGFVRKIHRKFNPVPFEKAIKENIVFVRGISVKERVKFSGLGTYYRDEAKIYNNSKSVEQLFMLPEYTFKQLYSHFNSQTFSENISREMLLSNSEFLVTWKIEPKKWWTNDFQGKDKKLNLLRIGSVKGKELYYLFRGRNYKKGVQLSPKLNLTNDKGYYSIRLALLNERGIAPKIEYINKDSCVEIKSVFALPKRENAFIRVYSWPILGSESRLMTKEVFSACKVIFEEMGYIIEEVS